jgi:hypothetical protein
MAKPPKDSKSAKVGMPEPLLIMLDTSILRAEIKPKPDTKLATLIDHAKKNELRLSAPEVAASEWVSQKTEEVLKLLAAEQTAIDAVTRHPFLSKHVRRPAIKPIDSKTLGRKSDLFFRQRLEELHIDVEQIHPDDYAKAMLGYFDGSPPYGSRRSRNDIPDALIFECVKRAHLITRNLIFVCNDERLRKSVQACGITVAESIDALIKLDQVTSVTVSGNFAIWWNLTEETVVDFLNSYESELQSQLESDVVNAIAGETIRYSRIPNDDMEGYVDSVGVDDIQFDWNAATVIGDDVIEVPCAIDVDLALSFPIYKADSLEPPKWVSVQFGDWEEDHYFDASGSISARYSATLVVRIKERSANPTLDDLDLSIEEIELVDD